ncbi:MAG: hypothetical protein M1814_000056 [Vezdaea aestivalis]|nr:MAG: hypothetical protein M1814_000056 [Vezdaea aestivalis]
MPQNLNLRAPARTAPIDPQARFLWTILKQLDHKSIDWNEVARDLKITNGHAARMRFSRFKGQIEGRQPRKAAADRARPAPRAIAVPQNEVEEDHKVEIEDDARENDRSTTMTDVGSSEPVGRVKQEEGDGQWGNKKLETVDEQGVGVQFKDEPAGN